MKQRSWRIFSGLAGFSLILCLIAAGVLIPSNYNDYGMWSSEYLQSVQPREGRIEAWFAVLATGWIPAVWIVLRCASACRNVRSRKWAARGLCPSCGYDTRMTSDRCPECGWRISDGAGAGPAGDRAGT